MKFYKDQYQSQLARARQMNKEVMAELAKSKKNDPKSGWWPFVVTQQNRQHAILDALGENLGLGEQLSELKAQYAVLASKVATDNKLVAAGLAPVLWFPTHTRSTPNHILPLSKSAASIYT